MTITYSLVLYNSYHVATVATYEWRPTFYSNFTPETFSVLCVYGQFKFVLLK